MIKKDGRTRIPQRGREILWILHPDTTFSRYYFHFSLGEERGVEQSITRFTTNTKTSQFIPDSVLLGTSAFASFFQDSGFCDFISVSNDWNGFKYRNVLKDHCCCIFQPISRKGVKREGWLCRAMTSKEGAFLPQSRLHVPPFAKRVLRPPIPPEWHICLISLSLLVKLTDINSCSFLTKTLYTE